MKPSTPDDTEAAPVRGGGRASLGQQLGTSIAATAVLLVLCCGAYPVLVWGLAQWLFPFQANGSLVLADGSPTTQAGEARGSALLSQAFTAPQYFHPRPSAAGAGHDATASGGSNLGPLSDKLVNGLVARDAQGRETLAYDGIRLRTLRYALENGIAFRSSIPLDRFRGADGRLDEVAIAKAFPHAGDTPDRRPLILDGFTTPIPGDAVTASGSGLDPHISPANAALQAARVARSRGVGVEAVARLIDEHTDRPALGILGEPGVRVLTLNLALDRLHPAAR